MTRKCISCGGTDLIKDVSILDRGDNNSSNPLTLQTFKDPRAILFKGACKAYPGAFVCSACGYVMLFVTPFDIASLKEGQTG